MSGGGLVRLTALETAESKIVYYQVEADLEKRDEREADTNEVSGALVAGQ